MRGDFYSLTTTHMNAQQEEAIMNIESHAAPIPEDISLMTADDWLSAKNEFQMFLFSQSGDQEDFGAWIERYAEQFNYFYQQCYANNPQKIFDWYKGVHTGDTAHDDELSKDWEKHTEPTTLH